MHKSWWKIAAVVLLVYTIAGGFLMNVPRRFILNESIRNLYFHVCMWLAMMILFGVSVAYSIKYLRTQQYKHDIYAAAFAGTGLFMGLLGYATGTIWANYTWVTDQGQSLGTILKEPKLLGAGIAILIYCAYFVLRGSFTDIDKRARVTAVYNIFAFVMLFPSIWIIPRLVGSLHPGSPGNDSGNPALNFNDLDSQMRIVFYPAIIGWTLLGVWITTLKIRIQFLKDKAMLQ
ncbi:MAG: cytochrome c biogenesis protein [Chitinophagaceae bacterium]|nr:cytochrome c biogenesis protein [Chitinophagaceae bacterium]